MDGRAMRRKTFLFIFTCKG
ncbi:unnamed protein product, partial [Vitis vinifera]|uniref:Uncharacterized protein n=1 Tax=Vitis vinifera TaxID=29760 RepID=E0CT82_VITVI